MDRSAAELGEDFLYENAPLVEVIAEVRWSLTPLKAVPGGAVDPYFEAGSRAFLESVREEFSHVEQLVPEGLPIEFLAGQPVLRSRIAPNRWPLFQLGPGLFTCNIVPRYEGWSEFRRVLGKGLAALSEAFPMGTKFAKVESGQLRYVSAFSGIHGMTDYMQFVREELGFEVTARKGLLLRLGAKSSPISAAGEITIPVDSPTHSSLTLRVSPGKRDGAAVVLTDLRLAIRGSETPQSEDRLAVWFDEAHCTIRAAFQEVTSDELKDRMGPKQPIGGDNGD